MSLRPIVPQSDARIEWESEVQTLLCSLCDCGNGDAQGIIEAQGSYVDLLFAAGATPAEAAKMIDDASTVKSADDALDDFNYVGSRHHY